MSTLTINYDLLGDNGAFVRTQVEYFRTEEGGNQPDNKIYGVLKMLSATFKTRFENAVKLVSTEKPKVKSVTDIFNEFVAAAEWQSRFNEAAQAIVEADAEIKETLAQVADTNLALEPIYSKGETPEVIGLMIRLMKAENKAAFDMAAGPIADRENANLGIAKVSHDAVRDLWPGGMTKTVRDGHEQPEWKAIKVEKDDGTGKWQASGRVQAPVDPNKPTLRIGGKGKALTITYGEEMVVRKGTNRNVDYSDGGRYAAERGLKDKDGNVVFPKDFGRKNGELVIVATDWPNVGKARLERAGLTIVEE